MTTATKERPAETGVAVRREQTALQALDAELERRRAVLDASAASLIDPHRLKAVVLSQFTRNPELWECDTVSVARAVVEAAQMGLEPTGAIGGAHLVPFFNNKSGKKEAQLIIDYRGYVQLARRSGDVSKVWARIVRERDEFWVEAGSEDRIHHRPYIGPEDPGNYTHVYAVIQYRDGSQQFDWDTWAWVQTIRKRSKAKDRGPWVTDEGEMGKKSIVRRLMKLAPLTVEARRAIEMEEQEEAEVAQQRAGRQSVTVSKIHERLGITPTAEPAEATETPVDAAEAAAEVFAGEVFETAAEPAACAAEPPTNAMGMVQPCNEPSGHSGAHKSAEGSWPA